MNRPKNEIPWFEWIAAVVVLVGIILFSSCCPKIVQLPPVTVRTVDTDTVYLSQPPIIVPAESNESGFSIAEICDSTWRANHPYVKKQTGRASTTINSKNDSIVVLSECDRLRIERDSLLQLTVRDSSYTVDTTIVYECHSKWHQFFKWGFFIIIGMIVLSIWANRIFK